MTRRDARPAQHGSAVAIARRLFGARVKESERLSGHCTFGVGGPAEVWVSVGSEDDLATLVTACHQGRVPLLLMGNGTNTLYADAGARGIVARVAIDGMELEPIGPDKVELRVGAGVSLPALVKKLAPLGLAGLEWSAGVPGTVGGAIVSNAGAHGACVADTIRSVRTLLAPGADGGAPDRVTFRTLAKSKLKLGYRTSRFRSGRTVTFDDAGQPHAAPRALIEPQEIITGVVFRLKRDDPAAIAARAQKYLQHRKETQPSQGSAGSVFKNPEPRKSGKLIQDAGLKPYQIGGAAISERHANFIVNTGGARASDVTALIAMARKTVRERFGIELELEVEPRGDW